MKRSLKKGELSRLAINLMLIFLILAVFAIAFIIIKGISTSKDNQTTFDDSTLDFKISQVKKVDDSTLDVTVKRNEGEGEFVALSFAVDDGALVEIIRKNVSMPELQEGNFSLDFVLINASKVKRVSVTPIFIDEEGKEVIGNMKDEYVTPNTCSTYCPYGSQCGINGCGVSCGSGCSSGYLCLNYKCVKEQSSSGGGSGGGGGSSTPTCNDTCSSLAYQCGIQTICGEVVVCGNCQTGYNCESGLCVQEGCTDTCSSLKYNCGMQTICNESVNCGTCSSEHNCAANGTCIVKPCVPTTCSALSRTCGTVSNGCEGTLNCGNCSTGYTCAMNGTCIANPVNCTDTCSSLGYNCGNKTICGVNTNCGICETGYACNATNMCSCTPETNTAFCSRLNKNCGSVTALDNCGISRNVSNCGTCTSPQTCNATNMCSCTVSSYTPALNTFCGSRSVTTNCGTTVTRTGTLNCTSPQTCNATNMCSCTVSSYTPALNTFCGSRSVTTNCGTTVTMTGTLTCTSPQTCNATNMCSCTVSSYTPSLNTFCGSRSVTTNCGTTVTRTGTLNCTSPQTCNATNMCSCTVSSYTPALNTFCGSRSVTTNCGTTVTMTGTLTCTSPQTCNATNMCSCTVSSYTPSLNTFCGSRSVTTNCGTTVTRTGTLNCTSPLTCAANGTCIMNCTTRASSACYNGDVYWYNSCGVRETIRYDCNSTQTCSSGVCVNNPPAGNKIIINHTTTNISKIPLSCINKVKTDLHIAYSHTSHGSQIYSGMQALEARNSLYGMDFNGVGGQLHFEDYYGYGDQSGFATGGCYDLSACDDGGDGLLGPTREFLNSANGQDINVIMWSWCSIAGHNIPFYLSTMQTAITEYPNVKFVFITGHAEGGGEGDSSDSRNNVIRTFVNTNSFCSTRQCILFDFADIENYDPDNNYFLNKNVYDNLDYNAGNWGEEYIGRHPTGLNADLTASIYSNYGCAHSSSPDGANINCALKGQAAWYMFARMVGWDGDPSHGC